MKKYIYRKEKYYKAELIKATLKLLIHWYKSCYWIYKPKLYPAIFFIFFIFITEALQTG